MSWCVGLLSSHHPIYEFIRQLCLDSLLLSRERSVGAVIISLLKCFSYVINATGESAAVVSVSHWQNVSADSQWADNRYIVVQNQMANLHASKSLKYTK